MITSSTKIGFIGLGNMGVGMANRLIGAGYELFIYNRNKLKTKELQSKGANAVDAPAELSQCDFVITMLTDDQAVDTVVNGTYGFGKTLKKGATHIAMSTISVELSKRLNEQHIAAGQKYIAAPVLGRPDAAAAGKLFIFVSGAVSADVEPIFSAMSQRVFLIQGNAWLAHLVKLACNFMLASAIETMAEAFALTRKGGIDSQIFFEIFSSTLFSAPAYKNYGAMIASQNYAHDAGFKMSLAAKDIHLILTAAEELKVPMPTASTIRDQILQALGRGNEDLDWSALGKIAAENAGVK